MFGIQHRMRFFLCVMLNVTKLLCDVFGSVGLAGCSPVTLSSLEQAVNTAADAISRAAIVRMFFFIVESSLFPIFFLRLTIARARGLYAAACHEVRLLLQLDDFHRRSLIVFSFHVLECFVGMFYKCEFR